MTQPRLAALALTLTMITGLAAAAPAAAQSTQIDLDRFDGRWFEIVRNPNRVQKDCSRAQIDFTPAGEADRYRLRVTCTRRPGGQIETLNANARISNPGTNTRFRFTLTGLLSVGGLAGQNYRVWDHAPDYRWAILALPDKSNWWIWHRDQNASQATRDQLVARARALGFDTSNLVQTGI